MVMLAFVTTTCLLPLSLTAGSFLVSCWLFWAPLCSASTALRALCHELGEGTHSAVK